MVIIPLYALLIAYALFLLVFVGFMIANLYHVSASASFTFLGTLVSVAIITAGTAVILTTFYFLQGIEWGAPLLEINVDWIIGVFQANGNPNNIPTSF